MTLNILVQPQPENGFLAKVLSWPEISVAGKTKEEALHRIKAELDLKLAGGEIVRLNYQPQADTHPWMKFAGMWKEDPTFDDFLEEIRVYREELDKEWEQ